jgi:hypothetical protein
LSIFTSGTFDFTLLSKYDFPAPAPPAMTTILFWEISFNNSNNFIISVNIIKKLGEAKSLINIDKK